MCFSFNTPTNVVNCIDVDDHENDSSNKYEFYTGTDSTINNSSSNQNSIANKSSDYTIACSTSPFGTYDRISSQNQLEHTSLPNTRVISTPFPVKPDTTVSPIQPSIQTSEVRLPSPVSDRSCSSPYRQGSPVSTTYYGQSPIHPYGQAQHLPPQPQPQQPDFFQDGKTTSLADEDRLIGMYTVKERQQKIALFRFKKMQRIHRRHVKYITRKKLAEERPRVKGRFTTRPNMTPNMCTSSLNDQNCASSRLFKIEIPK